MSPAKHKKRPCVLHDQFSKILLLALASYAWHFCALQEHWACADTQKCTSTASILPICTEKPRLAQRLHALYRTTLNP